MLHFDEQFRLHNERWAGRDGLNLVLQSWLALTDTTGKRVVYGFDVIKNPQYQANVLGFDEFGGIMLGLDDGYAKTEYSGEIRYL